MLTLLVAFGLIVVSEELGFTVSVRNSTGERFIMKDSGLLMTDGQTIRQRRSSVNSSGKIMLLGVARKNDLSFLELKRTHSRVFVKDIIGGMSELVSAGKSIYILCRMENNSSNRSSDDNNNRNSHLVIIHVSGSFMDHLKTNKKRQKYFISRKCLAESIPPLYLCKAPVAVGEYYCSKYATEDATASGKEVRTRVGKIHYALVNPGMPICMKVCPDDGQTLLFTYFTKSGVQVCKPLRRDLCQPSHKRPMVMLAGGIRYSFCEALLLPIDKRGCTMEYKNHLNNFNISAYELHLEHWTSKAKVGEREIKYYDTIFLEHGTYYVRVKLKTVPYVVCRLIGQEGPSGLFIATEYANNVLELKYTSASYFAKYEVHCQGRVTAAYSSYVATSFHNLVNMESEIEWTRMTFNIRTERWVALKKLCGLKSILLRAKPNFLRYQFAYSINVIYDGNIVSSRTRHGVAKVTMRKYGTYRVNVTVLYHDCNPYNRRIHSYRRKIKLKPCSPVKNKERHFRVEGPSRSAPALTQTLTLLILSVSFIFIFYYHV